MKNGYYDASDIKPIDKKGIKKGQIEKGAERHQGALGMKPKKK